MKPGEAFNCSKDVNSELSKAKSRLLPNGNIALEQINSLPLCEKSKKHWICLKICNIECDLFCWAVADLHSNILDACRPLPSESKFFQFHAVFLGKSYVGKLPPLPPEGKSWISHCSVRLSYSSLSSDQCRFTYRGRGGSRISP